MPVIGLPFAVEGALNNLLTTSFVTSWKIQGFGRKSTIVINMVDEQGVMADRNTVQYKRKPPSQIRRDRERTETFQQERHRSEDNNQQEDKYMETDGINENTSTQKQEEKIDQEQEKRKNKTDENSLSLPTDKTASVKKTTAKETTQQSQASAASRPIPQTSSNSVSQHRETRSDEKSQDEEKKPEPPHFSSNIEEAAFHLNQNNLDPDRITQRLEICSKWMKINFKNKERNTGFMAVKRYVDSDGIEELVGNTDDYIFSYQADNMSKKTFLFKHNHHSYQTEEEIRLIQILMKGPPIDPLHYQKQLQVMNKDLDAVNEFMYRYLYYF